MCDDDDDTGPREEGLLLRFSPVVREKAIMPVEGRGRARQMIKVFVVWCGFSGCRRLPLWEEATVSRTETDERPTPLAPSNCNAVELTCISNRNASGLRQMEPTAMTTSATHAAFSPAVATHSHSATAGLPTPAVSALKTDALSFPTPTTTAAAPTTSAAMDFVDTPCALEISAPSEIQAITGYASSQPLTSAEPSPTSESPSAEDDVEDGAADKNDPMGAWKKNVWTAEEDQKLLQLMEQCGDKVRWSVIGDQMPNRTGKQCRERWHNHLSPMVKKGSWSAEEDRAIVEAVQLYGTRWSEIVKMFPGRTDNSIKNRWNSMQRKEQRRQNRLNEHPSYAAAAASAPGPPPPAEEQQPSFVPPAAEDAPVAMGVEVPPPAAAPGQVLPYAATPPQPSEAAAPPAGGAAAPRAGKRRCLLQETDLLPTPAFAGRPWRAPPRRRRRRRRPRRRRPRRRRRRRHHPRAALHGARQQRTRRVDGGGDAGRARWCCRRPARRSRSAPALGRRAAAARPAVSGSAPCRRGTTSTPLPSSSASAPRRALRLHPRPRPRPPARRRRRRPPRRRRAAPGGSRGHGGCECGRRRRGGGGGRARSADAHPQRRRRRRRRALLRAARHGHPRAPSPGRVPVAAAVVAAPLQ